MLSTFETWNLNHFFFESFSETWCYSLFNHICESLSKTAFEKSPLEFFGEITFITFVFCVVSMCFNVMF